MNTELRELILKLIEKNSRLAIHDLAVMLDVARRKSPMRSQIWKKSISSVGIIL